MKQILLYQDTILAFFALGKMDSSIINIDPKRKYFATIEPERFLRDTGT